MASSQSRRGSAISTSSAVRGSRGSSPSPSASPVSPTSEGLSRRLSWNRPRENADSLTVQDVQHSVSVSLTPPMRSLASLAALAPPSQTQLIHEGSDLGAGWSSSLMQPEEQDWDRHPQRPFIHNLGSETSFESVSVGANDSPNEFSSDADNDQQHLTSGSNTPFNRPAPRVYDVDGIARSGPSRFAASVGRSPTLRKVSSTLRKASIRVVNIMGQDHEHRMERIRDEDDEESHHKDEVELNGRGMGLGHSLPPYRPAARPPEDGLRGRTLCIFTARSRVRRAMAKVLRNPYVGGFRPESFDCDPATPVDHSQMGRNGHPPTHHHQCRRTRHTSFGSTQRATNRRRVLPIMGGLRPSRIVHHLHVSTHTF
jgi:hypothetical protein